MGELQASLAWKEGGLGVPHVRMELLTLATLTVAQWASNSKRFNRLVDDILLRGAGHVLTFIMPAVCSCDVRLSVPKYLSSLWATGELSLRHAHKRAQNAADVGNTSVNGSTTGTSVAPILLERRPPLFRSSTGDNVSSGAQHDITVPCSRPLLRRVARSGGPEH